jgi:DNA-binding transcriptional ArsR family regulator
MAMDLVFKALADRSRRELLDRLHLGNGQTLKQLCADLTMTRQAVTKHLVLLEAAGLVTVTWQGREKFHYLNPVPLRQIATRWIDKYEHTESLASRRQPTQVTAAAETEGDSRWANLHTIDLTVL